jgi:glycerophosphoryl diester phosphodiesterase
MWLYPKIVAHRGGGTLAPENTLAAMRCAVEHGFRAVEFDVMLAADGVPVLMHDDCFGRTVRGKGSVAETTSAELAKMDAGAWLRSEFAGEPVPTYEQIVRYCKGQGIWMNVEIKPAPGFDEQTGRVVAEMTRALFADEIAAHVPGVNDASLPLLSSFSFDALLAARAAVPQIPRGFLANPVPADWLERLRALDAVALHINHRYLTPALAGQVMAAGYGLFCYTVNSVRRAREVLAIGAEGFCTDRIDLIGPDASALLP